MRIPGKTSLDVLSLIIDYVPIPSTPQHKGKLTKYPRTICVETTAKSPKPQENRTLNAFFSKFSPQNNVFYLCSKTCRSNHSGSNEKSMTEIG